MGDSIDKQLEKLNAEVDAGKHDIRDAGGRYEVGYDRLCVCGHRHGAHTAGKGRGAGDCIAHELPESEGGDPNAEHGHCMKFKAAPIKKPGASKTKTFAQVKAGLLEELRSRGWSVSGPLKIPHATSPGSFPSIRLWFKPQAVYMSSVHGRGISHQFSNARSITEDMRSMSVDALIARAESYAK